MGPEALILKVCGFLWVGVYYLYNIPILDGVIWCIFYVKMVRGGVSGGIMGGIIMG